MTPRLLVITDRQKASADTTLRRFRDLAELARPGSVAFQLRDLALSTRERVDFGRELLRLARAAGQLLLVNDRADIALLLGADGLHLGEGGMATPDARRLLGESAFISRAAHDPRTALASDAAAILLSPIVAARKGRPALGIQALADARGAGSAAGTVPLLFALGGVSVAHTEQCLLAGADGVAVSGAVLEANEGALIAAALSIVR